MQMSRFKIFTSLLVMGLTFTWSSSALARLCIGDQTITNNASLLQIQTCTQITGSLILNRSTRPTQITLNNLLSIRGNLDINAAKNVIYFEASNLQDVGGTVNIASNSVLDTVELPALNFITENLYVESNAQLSKLNLENLQEVLNRNQWALNRVDINRNDILPNVDLPNLTRVGGDFIISYNNSIEHIDVSDLSRAHDFIIFENNALLDFSLPATSLHSLQFFNNGAVTDLEGFSVDIDYLYVYDNANLQTIDFPNVFSSLDILYIENNSSLNNVSFNTMEAIQVFQIANNAITSNGLDFSALVFMTQGYIQEPNWSGGCAYFTNVYRTSLTVNGTGC